MCVFSYAAQIPRVRGELGGTGERFCTFLFSLFLRPCAFFGYAAKRGRAWGSGGEFVRRFAAVLQYLSPPMCVFQQCAEAGAKRRRVRGGLGAFLHAFSSLFLRPCAFFSYAANWGVGTGEVSTDTEYQ